MSKTLIVGIAGVFLLAALVIGVYAYAPTQTAGRGQYHDQMQQVLATGTYADLEALRAETGRPMMPFVTDEQSFKAQQERHAQMSVQGSIRGRGGRGCPMADD